MVLSSSALAAGFSSSFLYGLSDATGRIPYAWASVSWDPQAAELYVVNSGLVDVFSENGMAIYGFASDTGYGAPQAVVAAPGGDLYVLASREGVATLVRCNYRGEPLGKVELKGLAPEFAERFNPDALAVANGRLYLADKARAKVAAAGFDGTAVATWDFTAAMGVDEQHRDEAAMRAFTVDSAGNMLFTVTTFFRVYVVSPDGKVRQFGQKGSAPGKFGTVAGVFADESGHIFVSDTLRAVVMVFDAGDFHFLGEFGGRGFGPAGLIAPSDLVATGGKVYVTQSLGGIKVFGVQFD